MTAVGADTFLEERTHTPHVSLHMSRSIVRGGYVRAIAPIRWKTAGRRLACELRCHE